MKLFILIVIVLIFFIMLGCQAHVIGDINGDNQVSISDYTSVNLFIKGLRSLNDYEYERADINQDGVLNANDLELIRAVILAD